jgi:hypothetical protein
VEWAVHKYVLHDRGKKPGTFWSFHFHEHHKAVRQHAYHDPNYQRFPLGFHAQGKETWGLIAASVALLPVFPVAPFFVGTSWYCAVNYYRVHKKSHNDPEWGKRNVPWHYDHHMGNHPGANWCVTKPWFDYIMGSRVYGKGSVRERNVLGLQNLPEWLNRRLAPANPL